MTLSALQHIIRAAQALAEDREFLVLGSASLLASFPELGDSESPLAACWRERLIAVPDCNAARALEPHDLAAVKLLEGRPKDFVLLAHLHAAGLVDAEVVRSRLDLLAIPVELVPRLRANFRNIFGA